MCEQVSGSFCFLTTFWIIIMFITTLLFMLFSILDPNPSKTFNHKELTNYKKTIYYNFWYEIHFGKELETYSDYRSSLSVKEKCYRGQCRWGSNYYYTKNCSNACMNNLKECFYNDQKCDYFNCDNNSSDLNSVCQTYNRMTKWRNTKMLKYHNIYDVKPYSQIKPQNGVCPSGYKKCGIVNQNKDILCLNEDIFDFKCPINEIIVKTNDIPPGGNYKRFQLGDKYIFYTNEKTDNYIISNFYISFDTDKTKYINVKEIDKDSFSNFSSFNNILLGTNSAIPLTVYLNFIEFRLDYTYQEMLESQESSEIYTTEKIKEMNSDVQKYKELLMAFGIASLGNILLVLWVVLPFYNCGNDCSKDCDCHCRCCVDLTPMKRVIHFYICFSPCIILSLISLGITISKMLTYNKYSSMKYIDEYKNGDKFNDSISYNKIKFISLIINIASSILYPILVKLCSRREEDYSLYTTYN